MNKRQNKPIKKFFSGLLLVVLLLALCAGGLYAYKHYVSVQENTFQTGTLKINLNDGYAILYAHEYRFEPGMTVERDFFIKNEGTLDAYYKLYFTNVSGELADFLKVTIKDGDAVLYDGTLISLSRENAAAANKLLSAGETHTLTAVFHLPKTAGNAAQSKEVAFDLCADAVQAKNNPNRFFE